MKVLLRVLMAATLAFAGPASVSTPEAVAQQPKAKGKKGGGPAPQGPRRGGGKNRGGKIAGGIAAGIAAGIILNEIAKSQAAPPREERFYRGDGLSCRQLRFRCEDGQDWACRKYDRRC